MSTVVTTDIVWSRVDWPEDSHITDQVISEARKADADLRAAVARSQEARGAR